jgi:hypothetical protein
LYELLGSDLNFERILFSSVGFRSGWVDSIVRQQISYIRERASTEDHLLSELRQMAFEISAAMKVKINVKLDGNGNGVKELNEMEVVSDRPSMVEEELSELNGEFVGVKSESKRTKWRQKYRDKKFGGEAFTVPVGDSDRRFNDIK